MYKVLIVAVVQSTKSSLMISRSVLRIGIPIWIIFPLSPTTQAESFAYKVNESMDQSFRTV